jgi:hypothetical protein
MNTPPDPRERAFGALVRRARGDVPAPVDPTVLIRAIRQVPAARLPSWWEEFATVFSTPAMLTGCTACMIVMLAGAGWLAWDTWQHVLPWAEIINGTSGLLGGGAL